MTQAVHTQIQRCKVTMVHPAAVVTASLSPVILWRPGLAILAILKAIRRRSLMPIWNFIFGFGDPKDRNGGHV